MKYVYMIIFAIILFFATMEIKTVDTRPIKEPPALSCVNTYHIQTDFIGAFETKWVKLSDNDKLYSCFNER